jgi:cytoskeletal protein RodZ
MTRDVGGQLRQARKQCGLSLPDVAGRTKLSIGVLQAIERNDFESLPPGIYRRSYLRLLAAEVGLDPKDIAASYEKEFEPEPAVPALGNVSAEDTWFRQFTSSRRPSIVALIIVIALAIGWFVWPDGSEPPLPAAALAGRA